MKTADAGSADDSALALRVANGDAEAEEAFVARFRGRILALARARGCDAETANDIAQETLLGVLCALREGRLRDPTLLPRFVAGTARNLVHNHFRSRRPAESISSETASDQWDASRSLIAAENAALVRESLKELARDDRHVLELVFEHELSTSAIAQQLGTTTAAVRQRKHRALERLRQVVERLSRSAPDRHKELNGLR